MKLPLENIPGWINRHRRWVVGIYAVLLVAAFAGAGKLRFDDSLESWFDRGSPVITNKQKFEDYFGSNEDLYIVYKAKDGDVFSENSLAALKKLHQTLESYTAKVTEDPTSPLSHIRSLRTLINETVTDVKGDDLIIHPFIGDRMPKTQEEREARREQALANPDFRLRFVSPDAQYGGISIKTNFGVEILQESNADIDAQLADMNFDDATLPIVEADTAAASEHLRDYTEYTRFMTAVRELVESAGVTGELEIYYTGLPELIAFQVVLQQEMGSIFLGLFVLIFAVCFVLFRHLSAPVWTILIIVLTLILTLGAVGFSGMPLSSLSQAMIMLVILISVADVLHTFSAYRHERNAGFDHESAMGLAYGKVAVSIFLTTFTTVVGFSSLWLVKPSIPVANFGFMAALGLILAFVLTVTLLPLLMDLWRLPPEKKVHAKRGNHSFYTGIYWLATGYPRTVLCSTFLAIAIVGMGIFRLEADTNNLESFDESTEIRRSFEIADRYMGGTQNIDLMLEFGKVDAIYDADILRRISQVQDYMHASYPELIVTSVSIVNVLKRINQQLHQNDPAFYALPESAREISQLLFLFNNASPEERKNLISENFDATRISFSLKNAGSSQYVALVESANQIGDRFFGDIKREYPQFNIANTGGLVAFVTLFDTVVRSEILSFLVTLAVITATLMVVFRSWRLGALALVPNLVPVVVTFGVMGWLGITLDSITMVIAPIILGIAVDDTIHFIRKLQVSLAQKTPMQTALYDVLTEIGPALVFTSVVLAGGLMTMVFSSNASFQHFGYLSAIAIFSALFSDLLMVPAVCTLLQKKSTQVAAIAVAKTV
jgi:predicted RND superfamily exporter protein